MVYILFHPKCVRDVSEQGVKDVIKPYTPRPRFPSATWKSGASAPCQLDPSEHGVSRVGIGRARPQSRHQHTTNVPDPIGVNRPRSQEDWLDQPRSGERLQPTAQAVGGWRENLNEPRRGERNQSQIYRPSVGAPISFAPPGLTVFVHQLTHGLRRGLRSFAASRLLWNLFKTSAIGQGRFVLAPRECRLSSALLRPKCCDGCHTAPGFRELGRTKPVNLIIFQIHACNFYHSSVINNSPRAEVWQPVVFVESLVSARHLIYKRVLSS